ncbi:hypothetical protein KIPB_010373 [Kipferlia bialata]|uniref:CUB domain-containing protein n=1 Tax=Kipferlia bialata TaxID=797122 RepID=A0A9K3D328_9EUKA|nr:hypothetical protein KIPB_010373 [Kipferlia bialata]|eukprot:g10373.t1
MYPSPQLQTSSDYVGTVSSTEPPSPSSFDHTYAITDTQGTFTHAQGLYIPSMTERWVLSAPSPQQGMASPRVTTTLDFTHLVLSEGADVYVYVAHCDTDVTTTSQEILMAHYTSGYVPIPITMVLDGPTLGYADEAEWEHSINCVYVQMTTDDSATGTSDITVHYTNRDYIQTQEKTEVVGTPGTISSVNYMSNQHSEWLIRPDRLSGLTLTLTQSLFMMDSMRIWFGSDCTDTGFGTDDKDVVFAQSQDEAGRVLSFPVGSGYERPCFLVTFDTGDTHIGGEGFTLDYSYTQAMPTWVYVCIGVGVLLVFVGVTCWLNARKSRKGALVSDRYEPISEAAYEQDAVSAPSLASVQAYTGRVDTGYVAPIPPPSLGAVGLPHDPPSLPEWNTGE